MLLYCRLVNTPIILIVYFIISFTNFGNNKKDNNYYYDNIFELFKNIVNIDIINSIKLITISFAYTILVLILNKAINDFTLYHIYIPFIFEQLVKNINKNDNIIDDIIIAIYFINIEFNLFLYFFIKFIYIR